MTQSELWLAKWQEAIDLPQTIQVHPGGTQPALLVEAQQEVDECRGPEAGAVRNVQATFGVRGEV